jgi:hypothetical protein
MTISLEDASGAQAVPAGEPCGRAGLAIVALRQRHRQSWGCRCPCPGLLTSSPLPGSLSPVLAHLGAGASRTVGDSAKAGWRGTCRWPRWPEGCEAAGESRARHRRVCKACVRADRRASCPLQRGTLQSGVLVVSADARRAIVHATTMRQTSATGKPLIARAEICITGLLSYERAR